MAKATMDHSVSGCFGTSIGTKHPVLFTFLSGGRHLAHGTALSLRIWRTDLYRYQATRVKMVRERPEAFAFEFGGRVASVEPGFVPPPNDEAASKMRQL